MSIQQVAEFHRAFDHPVAETLTVPDAALRELRVCMAIEELLELADAFGVRVTVTPMGDGDVAHFFEAHVDPTAPVDLVAAADAAGDVRVIMHGTDLVCGIPGELVDNAIHRANMSKLGEDGKPVKREDGKILKGPNYYPPTEEIRAILETVAVL